MNSIRQVQELNKRELENGVSPEASWHADYRDTAYIYIGGLPFELSEGDVITIFSQFGEPTYVNLVRDKETGKSRGFAFLKYEDQRSTDLAVDNLGGAVIMGRTLKVDHTRYKKGEDVPDEGGNDIATSIQIEEGDGERRRKRRRSSESVSEEERPILKEERELAKLIQEHDEDDPMKSFLVQEKREEVELALARLKDGKSSNKAHKHRHHNHRSRTNKEDGEEGYSGRSSRHRIDEHGRKPRSTSHSMKEDKITRGGSERQRSDKERRRSPRRDKSDRVHIDRERHSERPGTRDDSRDGRRHGPRRDS